MKLTPMKKHITKYPDKYQVDLNDLLTRHQPTRWKNSGTAMLLLSALAASQLTGCANLQPETSHTAGSDDTQPGTSQNRKMNMAPIFDGIPKNSIIPDPLGISFKEQKANIIPLGNFPGPGFLTPLTEEFALAIIEEELKSHGLSSEISKKQVIVPINGTKSSKWSFDIDILGAREPIYAEFLPMTDHETKSELKERSSLGLPETTKDAATALRDKLCEVNDESTGVIFYTSESLFIMPEQNLRDQISEFVDWMKTTGLI